jgi:hypothetical protein
MKIGRVLKADLLHNLLVIIRSIYIKIIMMEKQKKSKSDRAFIVFCIIASTILIAIFVGYSLLFKGIIKIG